MTVKAPTAEGLSFAERVAWLRLARSERVGPVTFARLIERYGDPEAALSALPELAERGGAAAAIRVAPREAAEAELDALDALGGTLLTPRDAAYSQLLAATEGAPAVLSVVGDPAILTRPAIAVVGSRNASITGRRTAELLSADFGAAGYVIGSGLARGIDAAAHEAGLDTGTFAVMAGGLDRIYPPEHADLAERIIAAGGALLTEMPLGWSPRSVDFPRRNRIVSGLSRAVVVVEAARRSGTIHTARAALDQGREVFAVPGSPRDPRTEGCNALLKEGAGLVTEAADVLSVLGEARPRNPGGGLAEDPPSWIPISPFAVDFTAEAEEAAEARRDWRPEDAAERIRSSLSAAPVDVDDIVRDTGIAAGTVQLVLLELELAGHLARHAGGSVSLIS